MGRLAHVINLGSHVERVAFERTERDIDGHSIVVHTATMVRIRYINSLSRVLHLVPHLLLNAHRTGRIIDFETQIGAKLLQIGLCFLQGRHGFRVQKGLFQVVIEHDAAEVIGPAVHQAHMNRGVFLPNVHITLTGQPACSLSLVG